MFSSMIPCLKLAACRCCFQCKNLNGRIRLWDSGHLTCSNWLKHLWYLFRWSFRNKKAKSWELVRAKPPMMRRSSLTPRGANASKVELLKQVLVWTSWWKLAHSFLEGIKLGFLDQLNHSLHWDFYRWRQLHTEMLLSWRLRILYKYRNFEAWTKLW